MTHDKLCRLLAALGIREKKSSGHHLDYLAYFGDGWELSWCVTPAGSVYLVKALKENWPQQPRLRTPIKAINWILESRRLLVERPFIEGLLWLDLRIDRWARVFVDAILDEPMRRVDPVYKSLFSAPSVKFKRLAEATFYPQHDKEIIGLVLDHLQGHEVRPALVDRLLDVDSPLHDHLHRLRISG